MSNYNIKLLETLEKARGGTFCSGFGMHHTNNPTAKKRTPYASITWAQIFGLLESPQSVAKDKAQWAIFSDQLDEQGRNADYLRANGKYAALWVDIDQTGHSKQTIINVVNKMQCAALIYTTTSATADAQKWRVIIPLASLVNGYHFESLQTVLNDFFRGLGIEPDPKSQTANQVFYLPNKGEYYDYAVVDGDLLSPDYFAPIVEMLEQLEKDRKAQLQAQREANRTKQAQRVANGELSPIDAYKAAYSIESEFEINGYRKRGDRYLSPNSESGAAGVSIKGDKWFSSHGSDVALGIGRATNGGCMGDAFDLFCYYSHGNNRDAALKAAGAMFTINGKTLTNQNQINHMEAQGQQEAAAMFQQLPTKMQQEQQSPENAQFTGDNESYEDKFPDPVNLFAEMIVPDFPLDVLPKAFGNYCTELSAASGFDAGAYGFSLLVSVANMVDHRHSLKVSNGFYISPNLWGAIIDQSGGGKSPILKASMTFAKEINETLVKESMRAIENWERKTKERKNDDQTPMPPRPAYRQKVISNATIEAIAEILKDNPEGGLSFRDELSGWIAGMDAYKGKDTGERQQWLEAYEGGANTINRKGHAGASIRNKVTTVENWSMGVLGGIQPEILAKQVGAGNSGDGLTQRFLMYCIQKAGEADFFAETNMLTGAGAQSLFARAFKLERSARSLCVDGKKLIQDHMNNMRKLAERTASKRFKEHLNKYTTFLLKTVLILDILNRVEHGDNGETVPLEIIERANKVMRVLYRHSEAVFTVLDHTTGDVPELAKSAAEAILAKGQESFNRGFLTSNATHWQKADNAVCESAIDLLIELNWLYDVTEVIPGKRGRKSEGKFLVNPKVFTMFKEKTERVKAERAEAYRLINELAEERRTA